ncbi:DUF1311 domain-containing protein [Photobacterium damselae subsp. damselae]|nr:DUF1311 domain-containing protein [Photobacterium damselae subsp. damselae]TLS90207.1 DUF1311 domain-containing protein [Photobacterium damselae subsp. damselae]
MIINLNDSMDEKMKGKRFSLTLLSLFALPTLAATPSFDCTKASSSVEELICSNNELATLDNTLNTVYKQAMANYPSTEKKQQKAIQRGWIKGRNECWKSSDVPSCVADNYRDRILELQITGGLLKAPETITLQCNNEKQPVTVAFYNQTDPSSMVFTIGDDQLIAQQQPTASGIHYSGQNLEYIEHQGKIDITYMAKKLHCLAQ